MKTFIIFSAFISTALAAKCNADNCARAVTGTFRGAPTYQSADCQSYLSCTVSSSTSYATVTTTVSGAATVKPTTLAATTAAPAPGTGSNGAATTICPKALPSYAAKACGTDGARYSSACSCYGVNATTTTFLAPVVTSTVTATPTTSTPKNDICPLYIIFGPGQGACKCEYNVACGRVSCDLSQVLGSGYTSDSCRDACDNRADCQAFTVDNKTGVCRLCFSPRKVQIDSDYQYGYRDNSYKCGNPQCDPPATSSAK